MEAPTPTGAATNPVDATPATSGAGEVKEESPKLDLKTKVKAKVNEQDEDVSIEELVRHYQKERAADARFRKAAEIEKRSQEIERKLKAEEERKALYKQNPWKFFEENELDADKLAEQRLLKKIEMEMMSPAERKAWQLEQENLKLKSTLEQTESERKSEQERLAQEATERLKSEQISTIDNDFTSAVQELGIKPTPALLESVAQYMLAHLNSDGGKHDITAKEALEHVVAQQKNDMFDLVQGMSVDDFMNAVKPEFRESIRKFFLKQVKNTEPRQSVSTKESARQKKPTSTDDFFKSLEQKFA
jgi:hypothetical protein